MKARVTLAIDIDATSPELNDGTVDVHSAILNHLRQLDPRMNTVEAEAEKLIVTFELDGDFEEIFP